VVLNAGHYSSTTPFSVISIVSTFGAFLAIFFANLGPTGPKYLQGTYLGIKNIRGGDCFLWWALNRTKIGGTFVPIHSGPSENLEKSIFLVWVAGPQKEKGLPKWVKPGELKSVYFICTEMSEIWVDRFLRLHFLSSTVPFTQPEASH
jgi:hypothetical protein